ncbi:MAG: sarcosine oxidase subunit alpha family protein [Proteobacteria bacterium]|nr:sarcosine oxidase subunit alpha family protein [Pseudomonadota bacterium]
MNRRLPDGGRIDRTQPVRFRFNGKEYGGFLGDTLASALLANGVLLVARSFKYHRPRGIWSAGAEEPNALVTVGTGARREPNTRATTVEIYDGLVANSQNAWPSVGFDIGAINNLLSRFFSAGFYYKTFMWPGARGWRIYEHFIRRAAGMGKVAKTADPDRYERIEAFCDLLIVGSGPAGIAAAQTAARSGVRVILVDENAEHGGSIARGAIDHASELREWASGALAELAGLPDVTVLSRCTAFGYYDGNVLGLVERVSDHLAAAEEGMPRQRHWIVRARQVVLATGAIERPLLFANNDLPGIMSASAAHCYLSEFAVCPGGEVVIYTNNDSAYSTALAFAPHASVTLVDTRAEPAPKLLAACRRADVIVRTGAVIRRAIGSRRVRAVAIENYANIGCDLLLTAGGWTPTIALHSQAGGRPVYAAESQCFLPGVARESWVAAGACNGAFDTPTCLEQGRFAATRAIEAIGVTPATIVIPACTTRGDMIPGPQPVPHGKCFVDMQNDVTTDDLDLASREGYRSAELLKRYTTLGMGTDQGKTSNVNALSLLAKSRSESVPDIGVTTFRPPYTAVTMGAIAGRKQGRHILPTRVTPLHNWNEQHGALMSDAGLWKRALAYPRGDENRQAAAIREAAHVRSAVGTCDVSTLGKIDIQGPDAKEFLERLYVNRWSNIKPGKARYGVMLQDDGFVFDDGTTSCLDENHYFMTTTTDRAEPVLRNIEYLLQVVWPQLRVHVCDMTDQWAGIAVAGPRSRESLQPLFADAITSLPFMGVVDVSYGGQTVRVVRISFSGELGYEVYAPSGIGEELVQELYLKNDSPGIAPYGLDAMDILRIEKGHVTGAEIDGNRTLADLGLARMARSDNRFLGAAMMKRPGLVDDRRPQLVGLEPLDPAQAISAGSHLVVESRPREPSASLGEISSACFSPALNRHIGLGFLRGGEGLHDSIVYAANPLGGTHIAVRVVSPHFFDDKGERLRG